MKTDDWTVHYVTDGEGTWVEIKNERGVTEYVLNVKDWEALELAPTTGRYVWKK